MSLSGTQNQLKTKNSKLKTIDVAHPILPPNRQNTRYSFIIKNPHLSVPEFLPFYLLLPLCLCPFVPILLRDTNHESQATNYIPKIKNLHPKILNS